MANRVTLDDIARKTNVSKAVVSIVVIILNYIMSKVFVFKEKIQKN